ncbi:MAG: glycoside hydrolase family 9 protein, partial [Bacteroidota bacterium]
MLKYAFLLVPFELLTAQLFIRLNQVGYLPGDRKTAVVLSGQRLGHADFQIIEQESIAFRGKLMPSEHPHGNFPFVYTADFSALKQEGKFTLRLAEATSQTFLIGNQAYREYLNYPMDYLLQQRCGYNPAFDTTCHQYDAIAVDGPDSGTYIDVRGGYHDASDYLRFLITTSYTVGILLMSYKDYPDLWPDQLDAQGRKQNNGVPDILDEARWGLEWMLKLNPEKRKLYHQVADDRDHS